MRSKGWVQAPNVFLSLMVMMCTVTSVFGQDNEGSGDLDKAFDKKIEAKSTKDLDSVVKLCESAIEKGLTKEEELQAKQLASSALYEHAEQLSRRILGPGKRDPRWRILRSQSLSRLRKSVKFDPEFVDAFMMIAQLNSMEGGKREEAIESIDKAIEMADDDRRQKSKALYLRAILRDDETEQLEDLNEAIKVNPENMDAVRLRAAYYLRKKEPTKAIEDLNSWLDSDPTNTKNHVNVVRELMRMGGRFDKDLQKESIAIIGKAIKNAPDDPEPLTVRAEIKIIQDDLDGAVADASKALKLDPKNIDALFLRASLWSDKGQLDEALDDVNEILEDHPQREGAIDLRGRILMRQGKLGEAIEDYKLLANRGQRGQGYQLQLASLYNANNEPSKAVRIFNGVLRRNKDKAWEGQVVDLQAFLMLERMSALRGRADARLSLGEHKGAVADYEAALDLNDDIADFREENSLPELPVDDGILNNLAWVLATSPEEEIRNGERAIKLATEAAEVTKFKEAHILSTLASGYAESGDFEQAIKWIEKAIAVNKDLADTAADKERNAEQKESLNKEYESYKDKKPWREHQNVEEESKLKAGAKATEKKKMDAKEKSDAEAKEEEEKNKDKEDEDDSEKEGSEEEDEKEKSEKEDADEKEKKDKGKN